MSDSAASTDQRHAGANSTATTAGSNADNTKTKDRTSQARKDYMKRLRGLFIGIVLAVLVYAFFPDNGADLVNAAYPDDESGPFTIEAMRLTAAVAVLMGAWWMTEAIPLAATALVPLVVFPLSQVVSFGDISPSYADPTIFLFMGGFILALGMQKWNLHRRLALSVVLLVGTRPKQLILGFMIATGFLSMWVSNTATAVVMLPIGMSVLGLTSEIVGGMKKQKKFATALMLAIAYSASIGSLGTIIGTPPNTLMAAYMSSSQGIEIGFFDWMMVGVPLAVVFMVIAWLVLITVFKPEMKEIPGGKQLIQKELRDMGSMSRAEKTAGVIFVAAALSWVFIPLATDWFGWGITIADAAIGMTAGLLMFIIPVDEKGTRVIAWEDAQEMPWDVLLLFGGGLALSSMFGNSGLSLWIGEQSKAMEALPLVVLVAAVAALVLVLTEFTSNTATAATFLPIMGGVAVGIGLTAEQDMNVMLLVIPVALAATCAFMLPVATPPNAIAYSSGYVRIGDMVKGGLWLNVIAVFLITIVVFLLAVPVFGLVL